MIKAGSSCCPYPIEVVELAYCERLGMFVTEIESKGKTFVHAAPAGAGQCVDEE